jgi:malyl-CoA/(S)-citramalyl-CoA lyase
MRSARDFFKPLAAGAPAPLHEIPFKPSRVIHFFPPHNEKMVSKLPETIPNVDIILGNLEDAIPMADKEAARAGLIKVANELNFGTTQLWTRVNSLDSPTTSCVKTHKATTTKVHEPHTNKICGITQWLAWSMHA